MFDLVQVGGFNPLEEMTALLSTVGRPKKAGFTLKWVPRAPVPGFVRRSPLRMMQWLR